MMLDTTLPVADWITCPDRWKLQNVLVHLAYYVTIWQDRAERKKFSKWAKSPSTRTLANLVDALPTWCTAPHDHEAAIFEMAERLGLRTYALVDESGGEYPGSYAPGYLIRCPSVITDPATFASHDPPIYVPPTGSPPGTPHVPPRSPPGTSNPRPSISTASKVRDLEYSNPSFRLPTPATTREPTPPENRFAPLADDDSEATSFSPLAASPVLVDTAATDLPPARHDPARTPPHRDPVPPAPAPDPDPRIRRLLQEQADDRRLIAALELRLTSLETAERTAVAQLRRTNESVAVLQTWYRENPYGRRLDSIDGDLRRLLDADHDSDTRLTTAVQNANEALKNTRSQFSRLNKLDRDSQLAQSRLKTEVSKLQTLTGEHRTKLQALTAGFDLHSSTLATHSTQLDALPLTDKLDHTNAMIDDTEARMTLVDEHVRAIADVLDENLDDFHVMANETLKTAQ